MLHLPEIDAFVERQVTLWDKQRELSPEAPGPNLADQSPPVGGPWITVSSPHSDGAS